MPKQIFKYEVSRVGSNLLRLPKGAKILRFGSQFEGLFFWALVDPEAQPEDRAFFIYPTGEEMKCKEHEEGQGYLGTVVEKEGYVWHAFELPPRFGV
jgi:hypothetical protein